MKRGHFYGDAIAEWLPDGRKMKILQNISFLDFETNIIWRAHSGSIVDGASIPRFFWRLIGGPFSGKYRRASIIHDVYCVNKKRKWQGTHKMFYHAMLADGVNPIKAWVMYLAVRIWGPRW